MTLDSITIYLVIYEDEIVGKGFSPDEAVDSALMGGYVVLDTNERNAWMPPIENNMPNYRKVAKLFTHELPLKKE